MVSVDEDQVLAAPGNGNSTGFVAYVVQRFPALRTTFIRRDIEALRRQGVLLKLVSVRPVDAMEVAGEKEAEGYVRETMYLPGFPVNLESVLANLWALAFSPRIMLRCWRWAFSHTGGRGISRRARLWLQIWRGPVLARRLLKLGNCRHCHAQFADGAATTALVASQLLGVGFSFTSHTSYDSPLLKEKLAYSQFVASISEYDRNKLLGVGGENLRDRIHVIHCGIPVDDWLFKRSVTATGSVQILSVGALIEKKGHDTLIAACGLLEKSGMDFECRIVGAGPLRGQLNKLIRDLGLVSRVKLVGPLPQADVKRELSDADVFVLASRSTAGGDTDGIPVSLMEAMAVGVAVVSTPVAGIPELIADGETGWLSEQGNPRSLADAIVKAADRGPSHIEQLSKARNKIEAEFNAAHEGEKLARLLLARIAKS